MKTIKLSFPFKLGDVNCYLIEVEGGFVLIDTGMSNKRRQLISELESAGCHPGQLRLIVLTHGDFDHSGNAAYLRKAYGAEIAMHADDFGMVERGDMFWNRGNGNPLINLLAAALAGFSKASRFVPGIILEEGFDLTKYGLDATVLSTPGHSKGSIGILTASGDLFAGDLFENKAEPTLNSIMDDSTTAHESVAKLKNLPIQTVYPGHGDPFLMQAFKL